MMKKVALVLCLLLAFGKVCIAESFNDLTNLFNSMANLLEAGADLIEAENNAGKSEALVEKKSFSGKTVKVKIGLKTYDVHQECIDTLKKYEDFFDKYIEVMSNPSANMTEYFSILSQYTEMMTALEEYEDYDMSEGDQLYYLEVLHRVNMKLVTSN